MSSFATTSLPKKQQGVALITVLLVFALVAIIGAAIVRQLDLSIQATTHHVHSANLRQYALGTEEYVKILLAEDLKSDEKDKKKVDYLGEIWAQPRCLQVNDSGIATPKLEDEKEKQKREEKEENDKKDKDPIECENGILMEIKDAQGYLNINNLYVDKSKTKDEKEDDKDVVVSNDELTLIFTSYRNSIEKKLSKKIPQDLTKEIQKWISQKSKDGSEDLEYLSLKPPYRVARQPLQHISELQLVRYIRDKDGQSFYLPLAENLVALPEPVGINNNPTSINLLTAPQELIEAVCGITKRDVAQSDMEKFLKERLKDSFTKVEDIQKSLASCGEGGDDEKKLKTFKSLTARNLIGVNSQYFVAQFTVRLNDYETILTSYFYRKSQDEVIVYKRRWLPEPIFTKETS